MIRFRSVLMLTMMLVGCGSAEMTSDQSASSNYASKSLDVVEKGSEYYTVKVLYATNREENSQADSPKDRYLNQNGNRLVYGLAHVSMPFSHKRGELERPWFEYFENPSSHVVLLSAEPQSQSQFHRNISSILEGTDDKSVLIFVHGFNVSFEKAAHRTAQLAFDLDYEGAVGFFSWPSNGSVQDYLSDLDEMGSSWRLIREFFSDLADQNDIERIHIIAHSMGSRGVALAFESLLPSLTAEQRSKFNQLILTAPEIGADEFNQIAPMIVGSKPRVTLYASSVDFPLKYSRYVTQHERLGQVINGKPVLIPGMDSIDATPVIQSFVGHSYIFDERALINDVRGVLQGDPPEKRPELRTIHQQNSTFYGFVP